MVIKGINDYRFIIGKETLRRRNYTLSDDGDFLEIDGTKVEVSKFLNKTHNVHSIEITPSLLREMVTKHPAVFEDTIAAILLSIMFSRLVSNIIHLRLFMLTVLIRRRSDNLLKIIPQRTF